MTNSTLPSKDVSELIDALTTDCKWLRDNGIDFVGVERNVQKAIRALKRQPPTPETGEQLKVSETSERLNRLQLERLALQAINSLPCPDAEPLAKMLDEQFERLTGYRTKNWPHGAETMRLERVPTPKANEGLK